MSNILLVTPGAYGAHGGIAQANRDFLDALARVDSIDDVVVLSRLTDFPFESDMIDDKISNIRFASSGKFSYLLALIYVLIKNKKFDLVICGHINLISIAYVAAKVSRSKLILYSHGIEVWKEPKGYLKRLFSKKVDAVITVSDFSKNKIASWIKNKPVTVLPNMIDLARFSPGAGDQLFVKRHQLQNKKTILTLARLDQAERYKGIDEVLELIPNLIKKYANLVYLIAGKGNDSARLQKKVERLGICDHVRFLGYIPESEKVGLYRSVDLFVMPGWGEGFGLVYLEALACGVPVIGSKLDGSRDALLNGRLGELVDPHQPNELLSAIDRGLSRENGVVSEEIQYFSKENYMQRVKLFINKIMGSR